MDKVKDIFLTRMEFTPDYTIGILRFDQFTCFTLEDAVREVKIKHHTAIPFGRYKIVRTYSDRFRRVLPLLLGVRDYAGIRIHPGNSGDDTSGCILLGREKGAGIIYNSRAAVGEFDNLLENTLAAGWEVFITIIDGRKNEKLSNNPDGIDNGVRAS